MSWLSLVYPALICNYLGQGAFLLGGSTVQNSNVFYSMVPAAMMVPMVILATFATVIASQALISGAFSLATQAMALGLFPRMRVVHTHHAHAGQIYVPFINWALFAGCTALVVSFGSSTNLAAAYGLSVSGVMLATTLAMTAVARLRWHWPWYKVLLLFVPLGIIDVAYLTANSLKFLDGGYIPLTLGLLLFVVMTTWRWGRKATFAAYSSKHTMTMQQLVELKRTAQLFDRNSILMVPKPLRQASDNAPALAQLLWDRFGALPQNLIFVEVVHRKIPYIHHDRYHVTVFERTPGRGSIISVTISFGFMEAPNVESVLEELAAHHEIDLPRDPHKWIVNVSQENVTAARGAGRFARARLRLFAFLRQISTPSYYYYGLGNEVQLATEIIPVRLS